MRRRRGQMQEIIFPKDYFTEAPKKHRLRGQWMFLLFVFACIFGTYYIFFSVDRSHGKIFQATMLHMGELYCETNVSFLQNALADYSARNEYLKEGYCGNESTMIVVPTGKFYSGKTSYGANAIIAEGRILGRPAHIVFFVTNDPYIVSYVSAQ